jgi:hypothetical protein
MKKLFISLAIGTVIGFVIGATSTYYLNLQKDDVCDDIELTPYPGMEFLYTNLEYKYEPVFTGKSCPDSEYSEQTCEEGQKDIATLLADQDYKNNFKLFNFIAEHLGEPVYLRLFFPFMFNNAPLGKEFVFSLPGTNERVSPNDTMEKRFSLAKENTSANLLFGRPYRAFGAGIILEDPRQVTNGINEVISHPEGTVEIRGFFKFEELGNEKGVHYYRGRAISVDLDRGLLTEQRYSYAHMMLGVVQNIW